MLTDLFFARKHTHANVNDIRARNHAQREMARSGAFRDFFFSVPVSLPSVVAVGVDSTKLERERAVRELFSRHVYTEHNAISSLRLLLPLRHVFHKRTIPSFF